jgi:hypothetical protein
MGSDRSYANSYAKFLVVNVNIVFFWVGLLLLGLSLYLWIADWGDGLTSSFFLGSGIVIALLGIIVCTVAFLGCQGVNNQTSKFGFWSGRKILIIYLLYVILMFVCMLGLMSLALSNVERFGITVDLLQTYPTHYPPLTGIEHMLQEKFNQFFFGASNACTTSLYFWFWHWVGDNCPPSLHDAYCQGCYPYSPTQCPADEEQCYESSLPYHQNPACPYSVCREGILSYYIYRLRPFGYTCFALVLFLIFVASATLMLVCYHPKDTVEQISYKSGLSTRRPAQNKTDLDRVRQEHRPLLENELIYRVGGENPPQGRY